MFEKNKIYGILGLARSGIAAAYKIRDLGGIAFLSDTNHEAAITDSERLKLDFDCEFGGHTDKLLTCDEWIVSPGIPLNSAIIEKGKANKIKMINELEFGYQIKAPDSKVIAMTGTNGKSTTASLIGHIISKAGRNSILAGNIGDAFCSFPIEKKGYEFIVLEVSSFQLDLIDTFKPDIALLLNITPDHLDRYNSFEDYALSKMSIFRNQSLLDHAIISGDDNTIASYLHMVKSQLHKFTLTGSQQINDIVLQNGHLNFSNGIELISIADLQIEGPHNYANAMAAGLACVLAGISLEDIRQGLKSFSSLKHRLQFVSSVDNIAFYNDSKATNTDSVKYALNSFNRPIRIIMGGSDKGEDFSNLTDLLAEKAKKVYITGETSEKMSLTWKGKVPISVIDDFEECVRLAFTEADPGDIVVLSPACASFDKFKNFEHRGDTFISIVKKIAIAHEKAQ